MAKITKEKLINLISTKEPEPVKRIKCIDGYSVSVQVGSFWYCKPQLDGMKDYTHVEVGFPSILDPELEEYAETADTISTVFGCVPIEIVVDIINKHGWKPATKQGSKK